MPRIEIPTTRPICVEAPSRRMIVRRPASCRTNTPAWRQRLGYGIMFTAILVITMQAFYALQVRAMHDPHPVGWVRQRQRQRQRQPGGHDSSRGTGSSSVLSSANNRTVDIPHGGDTSTEARVSVNAPEYRDASDVHTDLSNVARKIVQDFQTELSVLAQQNSIDMKMLFSSVTFEIQKARHEQRQSITNMTEERHQLSQSGSIVDTEDESPLASSNLASSHIEDVDDEAFVDASSVPQENSEFHELVVDVAGTSDIDIDDTASSNGAKAAVISKVMMNDDILDDTDGYLDLDEKVSSEIDAANSQEALTVTKKKRKRTKSQKAKNVPVADMKGSALRDDTSTPDDEYGDIDRKSDLLPTATEVMHRSIQRLVLSTLTAAIVCLLYIAMKRFVSIMLGLIVGAGIQTGVSSETKSAIIPKP